MNIEIDLENDLAIAVQEYWDENPLAPTIDEAISEHDTILDLISRVEELEKLCNELVEKGVEAGKLKAEPVKEFEGTLREVSCSVPLIVCEDNNHKKFLCCKDQLEVMHLYAVTFHLSEKTVTRYVLAESLEGAVNQGSGGIRIHDGDLSDLPNATGIQLPLMLRGWSATQF